MSEASGKNSVKAKTLNETEEANNKKKSYKIKLQWYWDFFQKATYKSQVNLEMEWKKERTL